jgi:hypothetical protein
MADANVLTGLFDAFLASGVALLDSEKATIETSAHAASDAAANKVITAVTNKIKTNGLAGVVLTPLKNAIVAAEPEIDSLINAEEDTLIGDLEIVLKAAAARA